MEVRVFDLCGHKDGSGDVAVEVCHFVQRRPLPVESADLPDQSCLGRQYEEHVELAALGDGGGQEDPRGGGTN